MKAQEVRALSDDQVKEKMLELRKEQMSLRFQQATGQLEKTHQPRSLRRDIARLKTAVTERAKSTAAGGK